MGFFGKLFGKSGDKTPARQLAHPSQLLVGDIISLDDSFALPSQLRGQSLEVKSINSYEYEHSKELEWVLQGPSDELVFLAIEQDDQESLVLSIKVNRATVEQLFDLEQFSQLFDEPGSALLTLQEAPPQYEQWTGPQYRQNEFSRFGYFHQCDHRQSQLDDERGDSFERYAAMTDDEKFGIEVEVYEGGETDVMLCLYRPISDIRQYWPKS